jgi:hypothetical protein
MLKNITLSADEKLIQDARNIAQSENATLNSEFRGWLRQYVNTKSGSRDFDALMHSLQYARAERAFTRDELNGR